MSLDKAILHKKEKRKPYRRSKAVDVTCRNHGSCPYCYSNRMHKYRKRMIIEKEDMSFVPHIENVKGRKR